ncbi:MAG: AAA family ATPase, partial [Gammaproteobacteria bacterium]|nr:AAA family ATPase [Gammaproteobacteria bacterium]
PYTARLVEGYFKLNNLGASQVKGVSEPIELFELLGEGRLRTRLDLSRERGLSPFIGREGELESLATVLQFKQQAPRGTFAIVEGDAGIGKSRLCHEIAEIAHSEDIAVYTAACVPYANAAPFQPIRELIRAYFGVADNEDHSSARQKVAGAITLLNIGDSKTLQLMFEFLEIADPKQPSLNLAPELRLEKLFEFYDQFNAAAPDRRSLVIVDDIHWADEGTLAFLERMLTETHSHPVSFIFNFRPHDRPNWLEQADIELGLRPLDEAAMLELAERLIGCDKELADLRKRLAERAAGNPYFVEEALQAFLEAGTLAGEAGSLRLTKPVEEVKIPDTIHAVIGARIDRLSEAQKQTLLSAAVIGKQVARQMLLALLQKTEADFSDEQLLEHLNALKTLGFMEPTTIDEECDEAIPCHWQFRHPLVQEVAYHSQLKTRRRQTHSLLAELREAHAG